MVAVTTTTEPLIEITDAALRQILALREQEAMPDLYLGLRITAVGSEGFVYETTFLRQGDVAVADHVEHHGELPVAIPPDSTDNLAGAVLDLSSDPAAPGLVLRNPNPASPSILGADGNDVELVGTTEERVAQLLDRYVNPAIAGHGGVARLIRVEGQSAYLELGGGCQGCGLAAVTLRQGIEAAILENIPDITEVVDVTDHEAGANPFYQ